MTPEQTDITLPGTIPGLLRRGSIVTVAYPPTRPMDSGVVLAPRDAHDKETCDVLVAVAGRGCFWWPSRLLALDLRDATSRAHAAWWLDATIRKVPPHLQSWSIPMYEGLASAYPELLDHLSLADPRLLSDGSRWVDAEALRLVCLHVAGVTP